VPSKKNRNIPKPKPKFRQDGEITTRACLGLSTGCKRTVLGDRSQRFCRPCRKLVHGWHESDLFGDFRGRGISEGPTQMELNGTEVFI
jgi:hypothetical protein